MTFHLSYFSEVQNEILDAAYLVMKNKTATLDALHRFQLTEKGLGIEGWFTIELLVNDKFQKWGTKKIQSPADFLIQDKYVELKGLSDTDFTWITDWWNKRKIKPSIVLFLSVFNQNMFNQIKKWRDRGRLIQYKRVNENWIVGIFDGMNELWCELWECRSTELMSLDMIQIKNVLKISKNNTDKYEKWVNKVEEEEKDVLLNGLDLKNYKNLEKTLNVAFKLTKSKRS